MDRDSGQIKSTGLTGEQWTYPLANSQAVNVSTANCPQLSHLRLDPCETYLSMGTNIQRLGQTPKERGHDWNTRQEELQTGTNPKSLCSPPSRCFHTISHACLPPKTYQDVTTSMVNIKEHGKCVAH